MGWFRRFQVHWAAKQYARRLGPALARAYGHSEFYSPGQIRAATAKLGLNPRYLMFGYAGFLPEAEYISAALEMPVGLPYVEARELFERLRPASLFSASSNPETSIKIEGVGYSDR
ncbi:MAG TPA: DUF6559 family protein [Stellaceae bacterium]|jgi:hypothetical protein|nr:DUF6559 family protein [Stellaceae bacterium]